MSRERKIHEWIEQQDQEEKRRVWEKICAHEAEMKGEQPPVLPKKPAFSWKKWAPVMACSLAVLGFGVFAMVKFIPWGVDKGNDDGGNGGRYFTNQAYEIVDTTDTLKDYAQDIGKNLLYFDWYAETDHCENQVWKLNDTQEIICMQEEIIDINTGCPIYIFVIEADIELDAFSGDENLQNTTQVESVSVNWRVQDDSASCNFEYDNYKYYLRVKEPIDENYILTLVADLLP